jgi:hypothetical protein
VLAFCHYDKIPEINQFKGRKGHFDLWFAMFQSMVVPGTLGTMVMQEPMVEEVANLIVARQQRWGTGIRDTIYTPRPCSK